MTIPIVCTIIRATARSRKQKRGSYSTMGSVLNSDTNFNIMKQARIGRRLTVPSSRGSVFRRPAEHYYCTSDPIPARIRFIEDKCSCKESVGDIDKCLFPNLTEDDINLFTPIERISIYNNRMLQKARELINYEPSSTFLKKIKTQALKAVIPEGTNKSNEPHLRFTNVREAYEQYKAKEQKTAEEGSKVERKETGEGGDAYDTASKHNSLAETQTSLSTKNVGVQCFCCGCCKCKIITESKQHSKADKETEIVESSKKRHKGTSTSQKTSAGKHREIENHKNVPPKSKNIKKITGACSKSKKTNHKSSSETDDVKTLPPQSKSAGAKTSKKSTIHSKVSRKPQQKPKPSKQESGESSSAGTITLRSKERRKQDEGTVTDELCDTEIEISDPKVRDKCPFVPPGDDECNLKRIQDFRSKYFFDTHSASDIQNIPEHECIHEFAVDKSLQPQPLNADSYGLSRCRLCNKPMQCVLTSAKKVRTTGTNTDNQNSARPLAKDQLSIDSNTKKEKLSNLCKCTMGRINIPPSRIQVRGRKEKLLVRTCSSFEGMAKKKYRIPVPTNTYALRFQKGVV